MIKKRTLVYNKTGLHARPANILVCAAKKFTSIIKIQKDEKTVDAKSIIALLSLGAVQGSEVVISAEGPDEEAAVIELTNLIESGFGDNSGEPGEKK